MVCESVADSASQGAGGLRPVLMDFGLARDSLGPQRLTQTGVMLWWGALITVLVVLAMLPWFAGLLVVGPVIGHATWHAYRSAVKP